MRVRLLLNIPVDIKHKLTKGKVLNTVKPPKGKQGTWVQGDLGKVKLLGHEYEVLQEG